MARFVSYGNAEIGNIGAWWHYPREVGPSKDDPLRPFLDDEEEYHPEYPVHFWMRLSNGDEINLTFENTPAYDEFRKKISEEEVTPPPFTM